MKAMEMVNSERRQGDAPAPADLYQRPAVVVADQPPGGVLRHRSARRSRDHAVARARSQWRADTRVGAECDALFASREGQSGSAPARTGIKVKPIQSLMVGTPSVSKTVGAEGLSLENGWHALIADTPEQFAQRLTGLATDDALWEVLALASRNHMLARHGSGFISARFGVLIDQVMRASPKIARRSEVATVLRYPAKRTTTGVAAEVTNKIQFAFPRR